MGIGHRFIDLLWRRGKAWRWFPGSPISLALGDVLQSARDAIHNIVAESRPGTATQTLSDWHAALGLRYDSTRPIEEQRRRLESVRLSIGGMTRNQLQRQIDLEFSGLTVSEVSANGECGVGECGVSYCNGQEGDYSPTYFDVSGTVLDDYQLTRLGAILAHFAPAHLIPCLFGMIDLSLVTGAEAGVAICGVSVCEGYSAYTAPSWVSAAHIHGLGIEGQILRAMPGSYLGGPTPVLSYQWNRDGEAINGATEYWYQLPSGSTGHEFTCTITATNPAGNAASTSDGITVSGIPAYFIVHPTIAAIGNYLTAQFTAGGMPTPNAAYAWYKDATLLPAETGPSISLLVHGDGAYYCVVTISNTNGTAQEQTNTLTEIAPTFSAEPIITLSGPIFGSFALEVTFSGTGTPSPNATFQWTNNGIDIPGATSSLYGYFRGGIAPGSYVCRVTLSNPRGNLTHNSNTLTY